MHQEKRTNFVRPTPFFGRADSHEHLPNFSDHATGVLQSGFSDHFPIFGSLISARQKYSKHRLKSTRKVDLNANHECFQNAISSISWDTMNMFDDPNDKLLIWEKLVKPVRIFTFP